MEQKSMHIIKIKYRLRVSVQTLFDQLGISPRGALEIAC